MKSFFSTLVLLSVLSACSSGDAQKAMDLEKTVMSVHDEVMPKSEKLMELKQAITDKIAKDSTLKTEAMAISAELQAADDSMMDWMANYNMPQNANEKIAYLTAEKTKIEAVKEKINTSIAKAEAFLKK